MLGRLSTKIITRKMTTNLEVASTFNKQIDLFGNGDQAKLYFEFRPKYTNEIVNNILSYVRKDNRKLYVDVACGSGQLTELISPYFDDSIGVDQSFAQLKEAPKSKILYLPGSAFELPIESDSVDLITVAQGLHWFLPYDNFFAEVERALKPGGVFVAVGYCFSKLKNEKVNIISRKFYFDILGSHLSPGDKGCFWDTNRPTIDSYYSDIPFPKEAITTKLSDQKSISIKHYINYLKTLSAYRTLLRSGQTDPMPQIQSELMEALETNNEDTLLDIEIPFFTVSYQK